MNKQNVTIKVGSRSSPLALIQVKEFETLMPGGNFELVKFETAGDKDKVSALSENTQDDFFTDTLDQALINQEIDITVHSAKDLPECLHEDLDIFALTKGEDPTDAYVGKISFSDLPEGASIATSSELRRLEIHELNPKLKTIDIRGTIEDRLSQLDEGKCDGLIVATAALNRLGLKDRIKDIMPWETTPLQGQLAIVGRKSDKALKEKFANIDIRQKYGKVYLVGAGPGDPQLITLKAVNVLKKVDCIFYDYLVHKDLLKHGGQAEKVYVGKRKGAHALSQQDLCRLLKEKALAGHSIARLKGGDPLIFGRGAEEIEYLCSYHIKVQVIPGVSSSTGIPSSLGIPLTARNLSSSVGFVSGHSKTVDEQTIKIPNTDTIVFFMGLSKIEEIVKLLIDKGWHKSTPIMVVSKGTCLNEKVVAGDLESILENLEKEILGPPAMIIVGKTVKFLNRNLKKRHTILFTGLNPKHYCSIGDIIHIPMIKIKAVSLEKSRLDQIISSLDLVDILLFTSQFGVQYFLDALTKVQHDFNFLREKSIVVIGKHTEDALREYDLKANLISMVETAEGLFQEMKNKLPLDKKKILFPRSSLPNTFLKENLIKEGSEVEELVVYENYKPEKRPLPEEKITAILFTSPSTVRNYLEDYKDISKEWKILSKGPFTSRYLESRGYQSEVLSYE